MAQKNVTSWLLKDIFNSTDIQEFTRLLCKNAFMRNFSIENLGCIKKYPILLLTPTFFNAGPNILVAAGFHGDEPGGVWSIPFFLELAPPDIFSTVNISFLPLVNPTGFIKDKRTNDWGQNPNRGFIHNEILSEQVSEEGRVLLSHFSKLRLLANDGFVSLHEDIDLKRFYIYSFEKSDQPGLFSKSLHKTLSKFFKPYQKIRLDKLMINNGIIFRHCDGSFEDFLFHSGVPWTACTETPGLSNIKKRIIANSAVIHNFAKFSTKIKTLSEV